MVGAVIGYFTRNILEGAAAMGLSAVLIPLLNNAALFAVFWGPVNAGLGALGAYLALRFLWNATRGDATRDTGGVTEG